MFLPPDADESQPHWYRLESRRKESKKKGANISGEVQMQFSILDNSDSSAIPHEILKKLATTIGIGLDDDDDEDEEDELSQVPTQDLDEDDDDDLDGKENDTSDETDDLCKPEKAEKRKKRLRIKRLRRKTMSKAYEFSGGSDVVGIIYLDIHKITDLPPERNSKQGLSIETGCRLTFALQ